MKKALKYCAKAMQNFIVHLILLSAHAIVLFFITKIWIDEFELKISPHRIDSQLNIFFVFSCLVVIVFLVKRIVQRKKQQNILQRLKISAVLALIIFSWLYFDYTARIISNRILNQNVRAELLDKTFIGNMGRATFVKVKELSYQEYKQFAKPLKLPKLNKNAFDITFDHNVSRSLAREYSTNITYYLPGDISVKEFKYRGDKTDYKNYQTVVQEGKFIKVNYVEEWW